jgi:hypothetical protein
MGVTKTSYFTDEQNSIAMITKALGHPARIAIIAMTTSSSISVNARFI